MATGRIGVTPTLRTRWSKQPTAGTTSLSGLDDNSVALVYDVGYEAVYRNGTLLSRGNDYTATTGTTVTLIDATLAGDIIEILANQLVPLADAISKGQFNAKGALLSATAASTPGVLAVGANDTVLTADSTTSTGLKWATPASGSQTLLSTTALTGGTVIISSISQSYNDLYIYVDNPYVNIAEDFRLQPNSTTGLADWVYNSYAGGGVSTNGVNAGELSSTFSLSTTSSPTRNNWLFIIYNYKDTTYGKNFTMQGSCVTNNAVIEGGGSFRTASAITEIKIVTGTPATRTFSGGQVRIFGVK